MKNRTRPTPVKNPLVCVDFKVVDGCITVNNRPVFLRGALDCAAFPKTGLSAY